MGSWPESCRAELEMVRDSPSSGTHLHPRTLPLLLFLRAEHRTVGFSYLFSPTLREFYFKWEL